MCCQKIYIYKYYVYACDISSKFSQSTIGDRKQIDEHVQQKHASNRFRKISSGNSYLNSQVHSHKIESRNAKSKTGSV